MTTHPPPLAALLRHHIATEQQPLPPGGPGICWIWAANGIYKLGQDAHRRVLVRVSDAVPPVPGLAALLPSLAWTDCPQRLPGQLLMAMLLHARKATAQTLSGARPIEQQYHVTHEGGTLRVRVPDQHATPGRVAYRMPRGIVLLDLHSHHEMPPYFSATDDADDTGLGVSAVIGRIFDAQPEIAVRLCCYGHWQPIPAVTIFDSLGVFRDHYEGMA